MKRLVIVLFSIIAGYVLATFLAVSLAIVGIDIPAMFAKSWSEYTLYGVVEGLLITIGLSWAVYQVLARRFLEKKAPEPTLAASPPLATAVESDLPASSRNANLIPRKKPWRATAGQRAAFWLAIGFLILLLGERDESIAAWLFLGCCFMAFVPDSTDKEDTPHPPLTPKGDPYHLRRFQHEGQTADLDRPRPGPVQHLAPPLPATNWVRNPADLIAQAEAMIAAGAAPESLRIVRTVAPGAPEGPATPPEDSYARQAEVEPEPPDPATLPWEELEGVYTTPRRRELAKLAYEARVRDPGDLEPPNYDEFRRFDASAGEDLPSADELLAYKRLHEGWWRPDRQWDPVARAYHPTEANPVPAQPYDPWVRPKGALPTDIVPGWPGPFTRPGDPPITWADVERWPPRAVIPGWSDPKPKLDDDLPNRQG
jgi:hypothetical protein